MADIMVDRKRKRRDSDENGRTAVLSETTHTHGDNSCNCVGSYIPQTASSPDRSSSGVSSGSGEINIRIIDDSKFQTSPENESLLGEQTPHGGKSKKEKNGSVKEYAITPLHVREIPLPKVSWADSTELSLLMCFKEDVIDKDRDPNVFKKHPNLTPRMRAILFDWLMEVCDVYKLRRVTYYLAIDYVDRYLSRVEELPKNQLQLLGITCLFIAAKVEEVYPPKLAELAYVTDGACTDQEMLLKEMAVLKVLHWDISPMTVSGWLNLYMQICYNTKNIRDDASERNRRNDDFIFPQFSAFAFVRASQLIDFCSLDDGMLQFQYSTIAASAIYYIFNRERALYVSGFTWEEIKACVKWMAPFYRVANKIQLFSAYEGPKDRFRGSSGLKKGNPNILVNEAHSVQTHMISLKMLEDVYESTHERNSSESTECTEEKGSPLIPSPLSLGSLEEESQQSLIDLELNLDVRKNENCDQFNEETSNDGLPNRRDSIDETHSLS